MKHGELNQYRVAVGQKPTANSFGSKPVKPAEQTKMRAETQSKCTTSFHKPSTAPAPASTLAPQMMTAGSCTRASSTELLLLRSYFHIHFPCCSCLNKIPYAAHFSQETLPPVVRTGQGAGNFRAKQLGQQHQQPWQEAQVQNITNLPSNSNQTEMRDPVFRLRPCAPSRP